MSTLQQVEQAILGLSQIELERLQEWFTELMEWPRRIAEPAPRRKPEFGERMTANVDRREKRYNYACIEKLEEYVIVAQDASEVTVFRRADQWQPTVVKSLGESVEFRSLGLTVPLAQVYEGEQV